MRYGVTRSESPPLPVENPWQLLQLRKFNDNLLTSAPSLLRHAERAELQSIEERRKACYDLARGVVAAMDQHAAPVIEMLEGEGIDSSPLISLRRTRDASHLPPALVALDRLADRLKAREARLLEGGNNLPKLTPPADARLQDEQPIAAKPKRRMTVGDAEEAAPEVVKRIGKTFFSLPIRRQAKEIGCSYTTWVKTSFHRHAEKVRQESFPKTVREKGNGPPRTVTLSSDLEEVTGKGERDEELKRLIAEQEGDDRQQRVHSRRRI
jgi:hypothetical protein